VSHRLGPTVQEIVQGPELHSILAAVRPHLKVTARRNVAPSA